MPVVTPWDSTCVAQPPARFRACADEESKQAIKQQVPVLVPPPKYPKTPSTPRFSGDHSNRAHTPLGSTGLAGLRDSRQASSSSSASALTTSERSRSPKPQLSIMELVKEAAKQADDEAAAAAAAKRAGHRQLEQCTARSDRPSTIRSQLPSSGHSNRAAKCSQSRGSSLGAVPATPCQPSSIAAGTPANMIPRSPVAQQRSSKQQLEQSQSSTILLKAATQQPALNSESSRLKDASPRAAAVQSHPLPTSAFDQHTKLSIAVPADQCTHGSDCGSDEFALGSISSLCSSSSSSSLCSAASCGSNASTFSAASRPKSILLTRSSISSTSSSASSPRFSKRVTWKDGQADEEAVGQELVAVRLLLDTPEMRQVRRDTWPERPGARRDAEEAAEEAEAEARDQQCQQALPQQQRGGGGLVSKLLEPSRLNDWREKLRLLQLERHQQRMELVQAGWKKQQAKQARKESQQQLQLHQQQGFVNQQAASSTDAGCINLAAHTAGPIHISAVASAHVQLAKG